MERNSISSFENLCRIFEMRIKLDKEKGVKTPGDVLDNYEKYSKKIDAFYNSEFQDKIKSLISPGDTLEEEKERLKKLINLLEDRIDKRNELEDRFFDSTGEYISGLQIIISDDELENKKNRLSVISKYLEVANEINDVKESISKLKDSLLDEENKRDEYENKNKVMEDELYSSLMSILNNDEYYKNLADEDINDEIEEVKNKVSETKETLDITKESVGSLLSSGLSDDYASYIEEAEKNYYEYKNKEIILNIYKLVIKFEDEFKLICSKREKIFELLEEKKNLRDNLEIETLDELMSFEKILITQNSVLEEEKDNLENITNYLSRIKFKEERLEELNELNNSVEVLSVLREYGIIDTYDSDDVSDEDSSDTLIKFDLPQLEVDDLEVKHVYNPYRIVEVKDYPKTLNVGLAKLKGESVREKVSKKLSPKEEKIVDVTGELVTEQDASVLNDNSDVVDTPVDIVTPTMVENQIPVWEVPVDNSTVPVVTEVNEPVKEILPVWESIQPQFEQVQTNNTEDIDNINIVSENVNSSENNMFWVPVSETNVVNNSFPNLNVPINNNSTNGNNNFNFPDISN